MHQDAALVLEGLGGEASNFSARQFTPRIAADADLVLTMTTVHRDTVLERVPRLIRRTFTLSEACRLASQPDANTVDDIASLRSQLTANEFPDVPDPIGQSPEVFATVGEQIASLLPPVLELCRRSSAAGG